MRRHRHATQRHMAFTTFLALTEMPPAEIREQAWQQINLYNHARLRRELVTDVDQGDSGDFIISTKEGGRLAARVAILALGYHDVFPDIDGFVEAWANTIIPGPFCDGYENRDRIWAIVANYEMEATHFPKMVQNWDTTYQDHPEQCRHRTRSSL